MCVDLAIGYFAVERYYGTGISASWISKTVLIFPVILIVAMGMMFRAHQKMKHDK